ncbi:endonuclease III related protein [Staphylococcus auricularis]
MKGKQTMLSTEALYQTLKQHMGPQGWWPASTKIEVILGAILVQNTNWRNAELALNALKDETDLDPDAICKLDEAQLQQLVRSSGFYKNKAKSIHTVLTWLQSYRYDYKAISEAYGESLRNALLQLRGVGDETADVLLVYIFDRVEFIPDSYTRRIFAKLGYPDTESYKKFKKYITLPEDFTAQDANEFHALLDNFGKNYFNGNDTERYTFLDPYFEK